jgi:hypothetical protein
MMRLRTSLLFGLLLPVLAHAQSSPASQPSTPSQNEASSVPASSPTNAPTSEPTSEQVDQSRTEKYKDYILLFSSWSGSGIFQLKPADLVLLAPLGGSVFNDTTILLGSGKNQELALGFGLQLGGSLSLDFEKQTAIDASLGIGPGLKLGRLVLGVFGGGGFDGIGLFSENANLFKLPTAVYGYLNGRANIFLTESIGAEVSTSILARAGDVDELRITGKLLRLSSTDFSPEQEGSAFGFSYTDYDGTAETFSILWSFAR